MAQNILTIEELFTPAPSGVDASNPASTPDSGTWLYALYQIANQLGLQTTSWQPGDPSRTILAIAAQVLAQQDTVISIMNQGGFLDFAADGTVTYTAANGQQSTSYVSPDPSVPTQNPNGAPTWLDILSSSIYQVTRIAATSATGLRVMVNTTNASIGAYAAGAYHVANALTGATYSNANSLTIPSGQIAGSGGTITSAYPAGGAIVIGTASAHGLTSGAYVLLDGILGLSFYGPFGQFYLATVIDAVTFSVVPFVYAGAYTGGGTVYVCSQALFAADLAGANSTATVGSITTDVTAVNGVSGINFVTWTGAGYESNDHLAARDRMSLQALSPNGPSNAYDFFALTSSEILNATPDDGAVVVGVATYRVSNTVAIPLRCGTIVASLTNADDDTGVTQVIVAGASPASDTLGANVVSGSTLNPITAATNATPIAITTANAHGMTSGDFAIISAVEGNTGANGTWPIVSTGANSFTLTGSTGNGTYTASTGSAECGDLGAVDSVIQANVTPTSQGAQAVSGTAFPVAWVATVYVPASQVAAYTTAVSLAIQAYGAAQPLGGTIPEGGSVGTLLYNSSSAIMFEAGIANGQPSYVRQVVGFTLNGGSVDLAFPTGKSKLLFPSPSISVIGV